MIEIIPSESRGHANHGWLESQHTFSFGDFQDPTRMGVGPLRVINEDRVAAGAGFAEHPHQDMEILSYVLDGILEHKDSMGNGSRIDGGAFQRMRAGTGVRHSEWNADPTRDLHFLQIWIEPSEKGLQPAYQEFQPTGERPAQQMLIASGSDPEAPLEISQDATLSQIQLYGDERLPIENRPGRQHFLHIAQGTAELNEALILRAGDAALIRDEGFRLGTTDVLDALLFDLPTD
ncbi:MAG: pirin family protein [Myxococcota bacterium]